MVATYGTGVLALDRDGRDWLHLWLNLPRQHARRVMQAKEGAELAAGKSQAPLSYYEAVCETPDAAADLAYRERVAAKEAAALG